MANDSEGSRTFLAIVLGGIVLALVIAAFFMYGHKGEKDVKVQPPVTEQPAPAPEPEAAPPAEETAPAEPPAAEAPAEETPPVEPPAAEETPAPENP